MCINDVRLSVNLTTLEMSHFDVILGMDWLSTNHVSIDCVDKRIIFQNFDQEICLKGKGVCSLSYIVYVTQAR